MGWPLLPTKIVIVPVHPALLQNTEAEPDAVSPKLGLEQLLVV